MIKYLTKTSLRRMPVVFIASLLIIAGTNPTINVHSLSHNLDSLATSISQPLDAPMTRQGLFIL
jgi:hypothetical protein